MDFISALSPWQWALVLAVPPAVVALYFLKLRRQPLEVPSTYLWRKSIEDLHVNSLWQRIRQNLLLYLQLLILLLIIIALVRPGWRSQNLIGERHIFLVDNSASMSANDISPTRLDEAKRQTLALIDSMGSGDVGMVVSFSDVARVEQGFTSNQRELRRAIENIKPTNRPTLLDDALRVAVGLASAAPAAAAADSSDETAQNALPQEVPPATAYIFSDGRFPSVQGLALGSLRPVFVPIGQATAGNLGIVAFSVRRNDERDGRPQAFASVHNFGDEAVSTQVELIRDGSIIDVSNVDIEPGKSSGVSFNLGEMESGILELRLDHDDPLPIDNRAWAAVNTSRKPKLLLVTEGNEALELALSTPRSAELAEVTKARPDILKTTEHQQAADSGVYDVIIYDRCQPVKSPRANTLYIGTLPPPPTAGATAIGPETAVTTEPATDAAAAAENADNDAAENTANAADTAATSENASAPQPTPTRWWSAGEAVVNPLIIDLDRAHPLMQWLDLDDVEIVDAAPVTPPPGGTNLLESNKGTLMAIAPREGFEDLVMAFDIYGVDAEGKSYINTTWPIRRSFPAFVFAVLGYLGGSDGAEAGETVKPGQSLVLKSDLPVDKLQVRAPGGQVVVAPRSRTGGFQFSATDSPGPYEVSEADRTIERFTVNLFDEQESEIRPAPEKSIQIGQTAVEGRSGYEPVRREIWKWLLLAGLVVLLVEWYIYNRRVYV